MNFEPGSTSGPRPQSAEAVVPPHWRGAQVARAGGQRPSLWALGQGVWESSSRAASRAHARLAALPQASNKDRRSWIYCRPRGRDGKSLVVRDRSTTPTRASRSTTSCRSSSSTTGAQILEAAARGVGSEGVPEGGYWGDAPPSRARAPHRRRRRRMVNVPRLKSSTTHRSAARAETIYRQLKAGSNDFSASRRPLRSEIARTFGSRAHDASSSGLIGRAPSPTRWSLTKGASPRCHGRPTASREPGEVSDATSVPRSPGKVLLRQASGVFPTGNATRDDAPDTSASRTVPARWPRPGPDVPAGVYESRGRARYGAVDSSSPLQRCVRRITARRSSDAA